MSYRQTYVVQFGDMNEDVRKGRELAVAVAEIMKYRAEPIATRRWTMHQGRAVAPIRAVGLPSDGVGRGAGRLRAIPVEVTY